MDRGQAVAAGPKVWATSKAQLEFGRSLAFGIVNVTSDSMYSGARSRSPEQAVLDGADLLEAGFECLDIGALAARSGPPVAAEVEAAALVPTIEGLRDRCRLVSADTFSPAVAEAALEAGAAVVNDISGGGPEMFDLLASKGAGYVLMHIEGPPRQDREPPRFDDVVDYLKAWFSERIELALSRGMQLEQIVVDPGLDFDLSVADNLKILDRIGELGVLGRPVYLSLSRKDFLGAIAAGSWERRLPAEQRGPGTIAATAIGALRGAAIHRLHDPAALQALRLADEMASRGSDATE